MSDDGDDDDDDDGGGGGLVLFVSIAEMWTDLKVECCVLQRSHRSSSAGADRESWPVAPFTIALADRELQACSACRLCR